MSESTATSERPWPRPAYSWYVVSVLYIASIFSFLDRQIISLMVDDIKLDLGLNDFEIGLLQGPPFGIFYAIMSIPIAMAADRSNRRNIIIAGVTFWSLATAACGLASNFWHLFLARVGVGAGEATLSPCSYSLISDYFRREWLPVAMSIFTMGNLTGVGLAMILGGAVIRYAKEMGEISIAGLGVLAPWQFSFIVIGLPGVLLALLIMTIREPLRRGQDAAQTGSGTASEDSTSLRAFFKFLQSHARTFSTLFISFTLLVLVAYGQFAWVPSFFIRNFGLTQTEAGTTYGVLVLVFGTSGAFFGGWFASLLYRRGCTDAPYRATMILSIPMVPLSVAIFYLAPDATWSAIWLAPYQFCSAVPAGLAATAMMSITPNEMRAKISSVYLFVSSLIGLSLGTTTVGFLTHMVFADDAQVGMSLMIVNLIAIPLAIIAIAYGMKPYRKALTELEQ
jgi:MFS family permease